MQTIDFKMPDIGEGVAEGEIITWKVAAGDAVIEDQVMVEVMTDKATVEIGAPVTGSIVEVRAAEGDVVPVGSVIVVLSDGAAGSEPAAPATPAVSAPAAAAAAAAPSVGVSGADGLEEVNFSLPDIGEGVAEGEITQWLVAEGDSVIEDQPMLEVMTDKATVEIGSPVDGKVLKLLHEEGATVPVGNVLLILGAVGGAPGLPSHGHGAPAASAAATAAPATPASPGAPASPAAPASLDAAPRASTLSDTGLPARGDGTRRVRAAPAVRRLARELGVDIAAVEGSGPQGRVTMADVTSAGSAPVAAAVGGPAAATATLGSVPTPPRPAAPLPSPVMVEIKGDERVPLRGMRKRIAAQMRLAKQTAAHFTYVEEIDVTELVNVRKGAKAHAAERGVKLTYLPFIIKATCAGLREFPILNSSLDEAAGELVYHGAINMGVAVDTPNGLIVPVVRNADTKSMLQTATEVSELAQRARDGKTRQDDIGGGTFTITNAGNIGGLLATPVINVPEVAILGVHAIRQRPWVVDGEIVIRDIMYLSISLDHRVVDGAVGARFMNVLKELLENPSLMLLGS
ncbi:MAG: pyruvate dehydrogenase E2 component (dihydrolipoamide acetyltransferase) [Pseudohongiellaceae bacterium]|jgi:pyruvate dehydrogenase E2 component (dihydrolipoamide acetyltransferase)